IALLRTKGTRAGADGVADGVRPCGRRTTRRLRLSALASPRRRRRLHGIRWRRGRRSCCRRLPLDRELARRGGGGRLFFVRDRKLPWLDAPEDWHHDQPATGQLVVADDGVAVVARFAHAAEPLEHVVGRNGTVKHPPR